MVDSFTEVEHESWFSRISGSIKGILVGLLLFVISFPVLFFNEQNSVQTARSLTEGAGAVISVSADKVDSKNEGKLVHFSGEAITEDELTDDEFNIKRVALRLDRDTEMYQWEEHSEERTEKKAGGGTRTVTEYSYEKVWSDSLIDSDSFHQRGRDHVNPKQIPVTSTSTQATNVTVGEFQLTDSQIARVDNGSQVALTEENIPAQFEGRMQVDEDGTLYLGSDPSSPQIGDAWVEFTETKPAVVSIIAQQNGKTLQPYQAKAGKAIDLFQMGRHSDQEMFTQAQAENTMFTWILRGVGAFLMFLGLILITRPISVLADVIPFLGSLAEMGLGLLAGLITIALSTATIGFAWLFFRPLIGVPLLLVSVGAIVMLFMKKGSGGQAHAE